MCPPGLLVSMHTAIALGYREIVSILLERGQDVNFINDFGLAPLHYATIFERMNILKLLCKYHVDINISSHSSGRTSLHYAVKYGNISIVKMLLDNGMNINATDNSFSTPLHHAIHLLKTDIVSLLMQYNADTSIRDNKGITPFCYAMYLGYYGVNKDILNVITRYNSINGTTRDINDVYNRLVNNKKKNYILVNLHDAARLGYVYILKKILYNGENINRIDEYYYSALHYAVKASNLEVVNFLIQKGIDIKLKDSNDRTALHYAVKLGNLDIINSIIESGADVNTRDIFNQSPLTIALQEVDNRYFYDRLFYKIDDNPKTKIANILISNLVASEIKKIKQLQIKTYTIC